MSRPAGRDVGRHEDRDAALLEVGQRLDPLGLALVAVDRGGVDAVLDQLLRQAVRAVLGAGEDQRLVDAAEGDELAEQVALALAVHGDHELLDQLRGGVARRDLDEGRRHQDAGGQRPDVVRERGAEQQVLPLRREEVDDPADVADEAHVQEAVRLVQDEDLDARQVDGPLGDVVEQPARRGHHDLGAGAELRRLGLEADAAVDGGGLDRATGAVGADALLDLDASSRVGTITRTRIGGREVAGVERDAGWTAPELRPRWRRAGETWAAAGAPAGGATRVSWRIWMIGSTKAAVLPVPVCAPASRSRRARTRGMASRWTGVGSV